MRSNDFGLFLYVNVTYVGICMKVYYVLLYESVLCIRRTSIYIAGLGDLK